MKTIIIFLSALIFIGCCPQIKDTITTTTTQRDTLIEPPLIIDSIYVQEEDNAFKNWAYESLDLLTREIDSLRTLLNDTTKRVIIQKQPFTYEQSGTIVTEKGDTVFAKFKKEAGKKGVISAIVKYAPIKAKLTDTRTDTAKEKELSLPEKIWGTIKDFIYVLCGVAFGFIIGLFFPKKIFL